jgi:hypothetical protein
MVLIGNRSWTHFRNTGVQPFFVWFVLLNLFFDVVFSISFKHFLLSSHIRICRATYFYFQLILWDSYYSIFSFLCNVLKIIVCPFVLFILLVVTSKNRLSNTNHTKKGWTPVLRKCVQLLFPMSMEDELRINTLIVSSKRGHNV